MRANALAVMAKAPLAGQVKTRLMPALSAAEAAALARALLLDQLRHLAAIADADLYLAFAPATERGLFQDMAPPGFRLFPQQGADLGARMANVFDTLHGVGYRNMVLIGGDLAPVPLEIFAEAFALLENRLQRVVFGPSRDGGYYLVGCNHPPPRIFEGMSWSHGEVLAQALAVLVSLQIDAHLLPIWFDIDTVDDLRHLQSLLNPALEKTLPNTLPLLRRLNPDNKAGGDQ
ncbi:MAG TPA: TIGR04282 family arsenosugar biosynthesis glycosyltransferase [Candidatus Binatia bacterium]|jgi:rSAM/selenodomain-associated transferase 1